jgi:CRP-like cAMP-binding protein
VFDDDSSEESGDSELEEESELKKANEPRILRPGHIFGEIAVLYGCERTALVTATKYSTIAKLTTSAMTDINTQIPEFKEALREQVFKYDDT